MTVTNKLSALQCVLHMRIQKVKEDFLKEKHLYKIRSRQLKSFLMRKQNLIKQREQSFLRRHNSEYLHSLLENLQTLQPSLYKQNESSAKNLQALQKTLKYLIARRKIVEKIKISRYFVSKR